MKIGLSLGISRLSSGNGGGPTTFDASFTPIARLSNNNLTLTGGAGANYPMGRSTTTKTSGKYYMELYNPESTHFHIGVCLPTFPYSAAGAFDSDNRQTSVTAFGSGSKDGATNTTGIASVQPEIGPYLQVAIDFGGRPWLVWDVEFKREKVGEMPTEMFFHFFKSFSDAAKCNINIKAEGTNEHHKIESIFKAFAKSIRFAIQQTNSLSIPSTKGVL